jgi:hypothetical protein
MNQIAENLKFVRRRIEIAAKRVGREPSSVKLVAVSKTKTTEEIGEAIKAGQFSFGENYAQELREKHQQLSAIFSPPSTGGDEGAGDRSPSPHLSPQGRGEADASQTSVTLNRLEWHFIGHLQKNKAKIVAPIASWVEAVDSLELAAAIDRCAVHPINCLIEVNIGEEDTKSGASISEVQNLVRGFNDFKNLRLKGLMIIPPFDPDPEKSRPYFRKLKELLTQLNKSQIYPEPLTELSMGMSHDFEVAIEEGTTIIRVGTAIFGERK